MNKHIQTLQYYKDYAESAQALNESLNREIKDCYSQIDNLRLGIKRIQIDNSVRDSNVAGLAAIDSMKTSQMEGQLHHFGDELHRAKINIMSLEAQLESQQSASHSRLRVIQQKQDEIDQLKRGNREIESKLWETQHKCETVMLELERQTALSASYQEMLEKRIIQVTEMQRQAEIQIQGQNTYNSDEYLQQIDLLKHESHQLKDVIAQLQSNWAKGKKDNEWLKGLVSEKGSKQQNLLRQISITTEEKKQLSQQLKRCQQQLLEATREIEQLKLQITHLKADIRERDSWNRNQIQSVNSLHQDIHDLKSRNRSLEDELTQLKYAKNSKIEELNSKIQQMNTTLVEQKKAYEHKNSLLYGGSDQPSNLLSIVSETSFQSHREQDRMRDENIKLLRELQLKNQMLSEFEDRVDKLTRKLEELNAAKLNPSSNQDNYIREIQQQLSRANARLQLSHKANKELNQLKLQNKKLHSFIDLLKIQNEQLRSKMARLEAETNETIANSTHERNNDMNTFGTLPMVGNITTNKNQMMMLQKEYSQTLMQNTLLLGENSKLQAKRVELINDLQNIRMELNHHANSFDQMKDLKGRLRQAYSQMDHMNRLLAEKDIDDKRPNNNHYQSPQRQARKPVKRNPQSNAEHYPKEKSPVNRLISPINKGQQMSSNHNGYWMDIQNKIKTLKSENDQLRKNLSMGSLPAKRY